MVVHAFIPSKQELDEGRSYGLRTTGPTQRILGHQRQYSETLYQKINDDDEQWMVAKMWRV